jgi:hypothetical protein
MTGTMTTRTQVELSKSRRSNNAGGSRYKTCIMVCDTSHESRRSNIHDRNALPVTTANFFSSSAVPTFTFGETIIYANPCVRAATANIVITNTTARRGFPPVNMNTQSRQARPPRNGPCLPSRRHAIPVGSTTETNSKNIAPMLMSPIPAWLRNYANVASAINRPSAMMPIRLAIRSATSNIWVVMIICASPLHLRNEDILHHSRFITRADSASRPVNSSSKKSALYYAPTRRPTRLSDALFWKNPVNVHAHWSQGAAYRSVCEFGGRGRQFPGPSDGFKILKRREFFINHRLLQHPVDQKFLPPKGLATYRFKIPRWCPRPTARIRQSSSTSWICPRHRVRPALKLSRLNPQFQAIDGKTIKTFPEILKAHRGGFFLSSVDITLFRYCSNTVNRRKFASTINHGQEKL